MAKVETAILEVRGLSIEVPSTAGPLRLLEGVDLTVGRGEAVGLVGESGSGKSLTCMAVMGMLPAGATASGHVLFGGQDLLALDDRRMRAVRGREIAMILQDPMTALNPVFTVGNQVVESARLTGVASGRQEGWTRSIAALGDVAIPRPEDRLRQYPHQLSGGMRQRVVAAMSMIGHPKLLLADEPTTALDVSVQDQLLSLFVDLQSRSGTALLLVSHDLAVIARTCQRVAVMYGGQVVERGLVDEVFSQPAHPYTQSLLRAHRSLLDVTAEGPLFQISGEPPPPAARVPGCPFAPRCPIAQDRCRSERPTTITLGERRDAACWALHEGGGHV